MILDNYEEFSDVVEQLNYRYINKLNNFTYEVVMQDGSKEYYSIDDEV